MQRFRSELACSVRYLAHGFSAILPKIAQRAPGHMDSRLFQGSNKFKGSTMRIWPLRHHLISLLWDNHLFCLFALRHSRMEGQRRLFGFPTQ